ncbi:uncharacterized protein [Misgurnus anguillicaudatus]|uniref:uncharacterized protein n=1 Tax=Misgurnus anguillicaudatus TaxID=75329 RepID=UPI003CCFAB28
MECGQLPLTLLVMSHIYSGHTQESHKPVLTVSPDQPQILIGQTVILRCDMEWVNVTYTWICHDREVYVSDLNEYIINQVNVSHSCPYRCFGSRTEWPRYSYWSNPINLTVITKQIPSDVSLSALKLGSFLLAASPYLLISIILGVKCYRAHSF